MTATTRRRLPEEKWRVTVCQNGKVVIYPPDELDKEFDDLCLEIKGNMQEEDKVKIGNIVCDKLNA